MASKNDILETLALLAARAIEAGEDQLATDIDRVVIAHGGTPNTPVAVADQDDQSSAEAVVESEEPVVAPVDNDRDADGYDQVPAPAPLFGNALGDLDDDLDGGLDGGLDDQAPAPMNGADDLGDYDFGPLAEQMADIEGQLLHQVTPRDLALTVTGEEPLRAQTVLDVADAIMGSVIDVIGPLEEVTLEDVTVAGTTATVTLRLTEGNEGVTLAAMSGTGLPLLEAELPHGDAVYKVTALAGDIEDLDGARQLRLAPPADFEIPAVPEGQHPINGTLALAEEAYGEAVPPATALRVVYRRTHGNEPLTVDQVRTIVEHPLSRQGLRRFGELALLDVANGDAVEAKVAEFGVVGAGEINPATLAIGAAAYRGTFDFGGDIGSITANAEAVLAGAPVEV